MEILLPLHAHIRHFTYRLIPNGVAGASGNTSQRALGREAGKHRGQGISLLQGLTTDRKPQSF